LQSYIDGEIVSQHQNSGEEITVRTIANRKDNSSIDSFLEQTIMTPSGNPITFNELLDVEYVLGYQNIRHYNFNRAITVNAEIDNELTDTIQANKAVMELWDEIRLDHPGITIDTSGQLDDLIEAQNSILSLFLVGVGLIYLILGTQFKSYLQPIIVLLAVPLAFSGAIFGLAVTGSVMSLYTMYGIVALAGIAVNSAIVLVSAANDRIEQGMSRLHATIFAARRRIIPVVITTLTTIAGLFSLAAGFAGKSLVWGPVATSIVSGLFFSTIMILITIPMLYHWSAKFRIKAIQTNH
jgi:multidrug efflux pump subunit AcrB